jgi:hypothetical protein
MCDRASDLVGKCAIVAAGTGGLRQTALFNQKAGFAVNSPYFDRQESTGETAGWVLRRGARLAGAGKGGGNIAAQRREGGREARGRRWARGGSKRFPTA